MKIQDFVDAAYYINLDFRTDRREFMENQLKSLGLDKFVQRFSAIKAFDSNKTEYARDSFDKMFLAGMACSLSHKSVIQLAKDNNYKNVLIFEDDALFYDCEQYKGIDIIESALDDLSKIDDWDVYFLGSGLHDLELNLVSPNLLKCECCISLQGYIVNEKCYDKILSNPFDKPYDVMDLFINHNFKNKYISYPAALLQKNNTVSDIGGHISTGIDIWLNQYNKPINKKF